MRSALGCGADDGTGSWSTASDRCRKGRRGVGCQTPWVALGTAPSLHPQVNQLTDMASSCMLQQPQCWTLTVMVGSMMLSRAYVGPLMSRSVRTAVAGAHLD